MAENRPTVLELCAGGGGQALGLESVGFDTVAAIELDPHACQTLRTNRPSWRVIETDIRGVKGSNFRGVDLVAGGVPCPPFSVAGKQHGPKDERDLFPFALAIAESAQPRAVMIENVPGLASAQFKPYRTQIAERLASAGYTVHWRVLQASDHGVSQLRPRFVIVALKEGASEFQWPAQAPPPPSVGFLLREMMAANGWQGAEGWARRANGIAPTLVGGSKRHGGPDLGPTRARQAWLQLGVDGRGIADEAPDSGFPADGHPRLTVAMAARLQGFPPEWLFCGRKTAAYRQVGNAFPPPVAEAVGRSVAAALRGETASQEQPTLFEEPGPNHVLAVA